MPVRSSLLGYVQQKQKVYIKKIYSYRFRKKYVKISDLMSWHSDSFFQLFDSLPPSSSMIFVYDACNVKLQWYAKGFA